MNERTREIAIGNKIDLRYKVFDPVGLREAALLAAALGIVVLCFAILRGMTMPQRLLTGVVLCAPLIFITFGKIQDLPFETWISKKLRFIGMRKRYLFVSKFLRRTPGSATAESARADKIRTRQILLDALDVDARDSPSEIGEQESIAVPQPGHTAEDDGQSASQKLKLPTMSWPRGAFMSNIAMSLRNAWANLRAPAHRERNPQSAILPRRRFSRVPIQTDARIGDPGLVCAVFVLFLVASSTLAYVGARVFVWQ